MSNNIIVLLVSILTCLIFTVNVIHALGENNVTITSSSNYTGSNGNYHVVGEVRNNSTNTIKAVMVSGTFYDSNGKVVAADFAATVPIDIAAGNIAPFHMILFDTGIPISQIHNYTLQVSHH